MTPPMIFDPELYRKQEQEVGNLRRRAGELLAFLFLVLLILMMLAVPGKASVIL